MDWLSYPAPGSFDSSASVPMPIFKASVTYLYPYTWGIFVDVIGMNWVCTASYWLEPSPQLSPHLKSLVPLMHTSSLWFSTRLRKEIAKWTGLWKPSKGTVHTGCLWECQLELCTVLLRMCLASLNRPLSPLDFQKKPCRVYWNLWRALLTHQPSTWSGSRHWQRNLQKSYILPFDLMSWRSGHTHCGSWTG